LIATAVAARLAFLADAAAQEARAALQKMEATSRREKEIVRHFVDFIPGGVDLAGQSDQELINLFLAANPSLTRGALCAAFRGAPAPEAFSQAPPAGAGGANFPAMFGD